MKSGYQKYKLLILLIFTDLVFILFHILNVRTRLLNSSLYLLSRDRGFAEFFQYTKELWVVILFLVLAVKHKSGMFYVFSLLFIYLLIDDSIEFHENLGRLFSEIFQFQSWLGLRGVDFGELLVSAIFGLLFFTAIALFYLLSNEMIRRIVLHMFVLFGLLVIFGVVFDMIEVMVNNPALSRLLLIFEEGGEMIVMSVITWFVFQLNDPLDQLPVDWRLVKAGDKESKR